MVKFLGRSHRQQQQGFSLIEILVVITIIVVLTTLGLVSYAQIGKTSRDGKRKSDLEQLRSALVQYRLDVGSYPTSVNFTTMAPLQNYISVTSMSDPRGGTYTYTSDSATFSICTNLESTAASEERGAAYCVRNP